MKHRWNRWACGLMEAGWLACVVGIPLMLSPIMALPFTADKVLSFRLLAEALGLIGLLVWMGRPRVRPAALTLAVAASAGLMALATAFGRNHWDGFWGSYMRLFGLCTRLHGWVLFLVIAAFFRSERQWRRLLGGVAILSAVVCTHALLQWRGVEAQVLQRLLGHAFHWGDINSEQYRPFATLGNPSFLGTFLVFAMAILLGAAITPPRKRRWPIPLLGLVLLVLVVNQTRGAWLAAAAAGLVFALLVAPAQKRRQILVVSGGMALAVLLFGLVCSRFSSAPWVRSNSVCVRLAYFFQRDRNSSGWYRLDMWRRVGSEVAASPGSLLLGYGPESYLLVNSRWFEPAYADGSEPAQFMDSTHNIFLDALVEGGVLGLGALLAVLFLAFRTGLQSLRRSTDAARRAVLITGITALAGYVVQGIFLFDHVVTLIYLCLTLGLIAAASSAEWGTAEAQAEPATPSPLPLPVAGPIAAAAVAVVGLWLAPFNVRAIRAQIWKRCADELAAAGQIDEAVGAMREACRLMPGERTYHVMLAASTISAGARRAHDAEDLSLVFREAEGELCRAVAMDPGDIRTFWPLGQMYQYWGALDREKFAVGEAVYRQAAALSPGRQRTYWAWGDLLLAEGKPAAAIAQYRYALSLDPSVAASQRALAGLYVRLGRPEQAEPLFTAAWHRMEKTTAPGLSAPDRAAEHEELGIAFLAHGRRDKARLYLTGALDLDPQRTRAREALQRLSQQAVSVAGPQAGGRAAGAG